MTKKRSATIQMTDTNDNNINKKISYVNSETTLTALDEGLKSLVGLTTNTYVDSKIVDEFSLNAAIDDETSEDEGEL